MCGARWLALTADLAAHGVPVPAAHRAADGSYTATHRGRRYALFGFVDGHQGTWGDADVIARAMHVVHQITDIALPAPAWRSGASACSASGRTIPGSARVVPS